MISDRLLQNWLLISSQKFTDVKFKRKFQAEMTTFKYTLNISGIYVKNLPTPPPYFFDFIKNFFAADLILIIRNNQWPIS